MTIYVKTVLLLSLFLLLQTSANFLFHHMPFVEPAGGGEITGRMISYAAYSRAWLPEALVSLILTALLMLACGRFFIRPLKRSAEMQRHYRSILFGLSDEVIVLDADYRITDMNRETLSGGGSTLFKNGKTEGMAAAVFRTGKSRQCRQSAVDEYGREIWLDLRIAPLKDEKGAVDRVILTVREVTREVKLEEQLRQSQKLEAVGALAGGIAHDFNNLLMTILLNIEYVMARCPEGSAEKESMEMALEAGRHAGDLVDQILTFSRKSHTAKRPLALTPLVKEILKMLRSSLPATIEIRQEIEETSEMVMADPAQIQQILINLCTNAADAMEGGPGIISVFLGEYHPSPEDPLPESDLGRRRYLRLTVEDNGAGISPSIRDQIFDPFFTTRPCQAAGMGLATAHGAVKGMEGAILVTSTPEKGSRFDILLPCFEPEEAAPETPVPHPTDQTGGHILVLDDDETVVQIVTKTLSDAGYETTGVTRGSEVLARLQASPHEYDMLITDLTMPEMTGIDLTSEIQALRPDLPVVMTTGYGEVLAPEEARKMGIRELVAKPVSGARLLTVTRRILAGKK